MKIHKYGNDYAYQQKQKSKETEKAQPKAEVQKAKEEPKVEESVIEKERETAYDRNQVQGGGEKEMGGTETAQETEEAVSGNGEETKETTPVQGSKKKKQMQ